MADVTEAYESESAAVQHWIDGGEPDCGGCGQPLGRSRGQWFHDLRRRRPYRDLCANPGPAILPPAPPARRFLHLVVEYEGNRPHVGDLVLAEVPAGVDVYGLLADALLFCAGGQAGGHDTAVIEDDQRAAMVTLGRRLEQFRGDP